MGRRHHRAGVFAYHAVALSAVAPDSALEVALSQLAEVSIQGFFIVSGALVAGSLARARNLADYAGKRARRLYPAYAVLILIPAAISFAAAQDGQGVLRYLAANLTFANFIEPNLPGLFAGNRFTEVNGALWTLKIEVMFYIALPLILLVLNSLRRFWWAGIALLYIAGEAWALGLPSLQDAHLGNALARQLPGQIAFFAMGITVWKLEPALRPRWAVLGLAGAVLLAALAGAPAARAAARPGAHRSHRRHRLRPGSVPERRPFRRHLLRPLHHAFPDPAGHARRRPAARARCACLLRPCDAPRPRRQLRALAPRGEARLAPVEPLPQGGRKEPAARGNTP
jgi:peptidoglycan/LPS O-acetylase OafA/YrhL